MHYLIITSEFPPGPGGIGKHAYCMAKGLLHNGVKVTVVTNMDYTSEAEIEKFINQLPQNLTLYRIKRRGWFTYVNRLKTILSLCTKYHFDKIIVSGQFSLWVGFLIKRKYSTQVPVEGIIHGSELYMGGSIKKYVTRRSINAIDKAYAVSGHVASLIRKLDSTCNIKVLANGIDTAEWGEDYGVVSFEWKGYPKLLTVGSVSKRKGQQNIINALPEILKYYPDTHYHIVGKKSRGSELEDLVLHLGLMDHVTIHGMLSEKDLKRAYKSTDIFCMLSEDTNDGDVEGYGIAILEANINGVPVIGSNNTGTADAIAEGVSGYAINPKSAKDIVTAIHRILKSDRISLRQNCISWAVKHNWNTLAKELM